MVKVVHFDAGGPSAERVISEVSKEVEAVAARPEMESASHEALVKESIRTIAQKIPERPIEVSPLKDAVSAAQSAPQAIQGSVSQLPSYLEGEGHDKERRAVEELVTLTFHKGLEDAIRAAKRRDPFIEDAFHDALTERLIPELKQRGILK